MKLADSLMFLKKIKTHDSLILNFFKNWNCRLILVKVPPCLKEWGGLGIISSSVVGGYSWMDVLQIHSENFCECYK
jgi:hypothetical protein